MTPAILAIINTALPLLITLWKQARSADPNAATYTDEQMFEMLQSKGDEIANKAAVWLAEHPKV